MAQCERSQEMRDVDVDLVAHSVNSIQLACETLKRKGAIRTLEEVLTQNMPRVSSDEPKIASLEAYIKGQEDFKRGFSFNTKLPETWSRVTKEYWQRGWQRQATECSQILNDLQDILLKAPEIEAALLKAGKKRLANHFKKLTTPPTPSEEGRSVMHHTA